MSEPYDYVTGSFLDAPHIKGSRGDKPNSDAAHLNIGKGKSYSSSHSKRPFIIKGDLQDRACLDVQGTEVRVNINGNLRPQSMLRCHGTQVRISIDGSLFSQSRVVSEGNNVSVVICGDLLAGSWLECNCTTLNLTITGTIQPGATLRCHGTKVNIRVDGSVDENAFVTIQGTSVDAVMPRVKDSSRLNISGTTVKTSFNPRRDQNRRHSK